MYIGVTLDVQRRLGEHQAQKEKCAKYLRGKLPLILVYSQLIGDKRTAYQLERKLKKLPKAEKEKIVNNAKADLFDYL